jgi:cell division protein FtsW
VSALEGGLEGGVAVHRGGAVRDQGRVRRDPPVGGVLDRRLPLLARPMASYYLMVSSAGLLLLLGLVMVLSASSVRSYAADGSSYAIFAKQAVWVGIGLPIMALASRLPPRFFRALAYPMLAFAFVGLLVVLVPHVGVRANGAQRWIPVGSFTLQPSEIAKLGVVLWGADLLVRKRKLLEEPKHLLVPLVPVVGVLCALVLLEPDMGTAIVIGSVLFGLLWVVGAPLRYFAALAGTTVAAGALLAVSEPYRFARLTSFLHPFKDPTNTGYQAVQGLYALASGGWWGEGLGASREKWPGGLPNTHTDFILAIIGEELGLAGTLVVVGLFGILGYTGIRIAHRTTDPFSRLAAAAATAWILSQAVVNMGAVVDLVPITGIPLPLVSFGGSALVPTMFAIGMLASFARGEPAAAAQLAERGEQRRAAVAVAAAPATRGFRSRWRARSRAERARAARDDAG